MTVVMIIGLVATAITGYFAAKRAFFLYSVIAGGQPAPDRVEGVMKNLVASLSRQAIEVFGQKKLLKWTIPGVAHSFVMYAFLILASVYFEAYAVLISRNPDWHWLIFASWAPLGFLQDLIAVLCLLGLVAFYFIRMRNAPEKLGRKSRFDGSHTGGAYLVLFMIFNVIWTMFLFRGAVEAHDRVLGHGGYGKGAFVSYLLGRVFPDSTLLIGIGLLLHLGIMLVFLIDVLHSKHLHIFIAPINVLFGRRPDALGELKPLMSGGKAITLEDVEELDEDAKLGVGSIMDFSWKGILDFASCTECGRCQSQCPAWNTDKPLSPKLVIMNLRDHAMASAPYLLAGGDDAAAAKHLAAAEAAGRELVGDAGDDPAHPVGAIIDTDVLWSCTNCGACVNQCPVDIEHIDHIDDMRRYQVLVESNFPSELNGLFRGLEQKGNPWNLSPTARMDWAQGLDFDVKVVGEDIETMDDAEWLFWVGCAGAYEDRAKKTTRAVAELFNIAGVDFAVLGNGETCTGDSARRAGNEFVYQALAEQNIETFKEMKVKKVVSTCPHCMNTLKNEYRQLGYELEVLHHTQLLNRLVRDKKLTPKPVEGGQTRSITYHDPCFLGRHNQEYNAPRELLDIVPEVARVEMERSGEKSFCCGAGGARMWMEETIGERINVNRTQEAVGTGADEIAVACPFCRVMLDDGLTGEQAEGRAREEVQVLDVAQMLLHSVKGEAPARKAPSAAPVAGAVAAGAVAAGAGVAVAEAPAAPAAGGSLFDSPAPAAGGSLFDTPAAEPASPAAPTSSGSLFDTPASTSVEPDETKPAPSSTGGSLFDVAPTEAPAPAAPAQESTGGSLFDIPAEAPAPAAPAAPAPKAETPTPAAEAPKAEAPAADFGGSLFDIPAEAPAAPAEEPKTAEPTNEPKAEEPAAAKTEEKPAAPAANSGDSHSPKNDADINSAGSLFDL